MLLAEGHFLPPKGGFGGLLTLKSSTVNDNEKYYTSSEQHKPLLWKTIIMKNNNYEKQLWKTIIMK